MCKLHKLIKLFTPLALQVRAFMQWRMWSQVSKVHQSLTPSVVCPEMFRGFNSCLYCSIPEVFRAAFSAHYGHARNIPGPILFTLKQFICCMKDNSTFPISLQQPLWSFCISFSVARAQLHNQLFDLGLNAGVCFIAADFLPSDAVSHSAFLTPCLATYQCGYISRVMFCAPQATWKTPD